MTTALAVSHQHLVALSPADVGPAQQQLRGWCQQKIQALAAELREQRENYRHAVTRKWRSSSWQSAISKTKQRMVYYAKIKKAVEAGFLVVPNFPMEVIAVRVAGDVHPKQIVGRYNSDVNAAQGPVLPPGQGRYVDEITQTKADQEWNEKAKGWENRRRTGDYNPEVDFPITTIKPVILDATTRAMALKLFDEIGVAHGQNTRSRGARRADPFVLGRIIDPSRGRGWRERQVTFFIAWWLNTETL